MTPMFLVAPRFFLERPLAPITEDNRDLAAPKVFGFRYARYLDRICTIPSGHYDSETQIFVPDDSSVPFMEMTPQTSHYESGDHENDGQIDVETDMVNNQ